MKLETKLVLITNHLNRCKEFCVRFRIRMERVKMLSESFVCKCEILSDFADYCGFCCYSICCVVFFLNHSVSFYLNIRICCNTFECKHFSGQYILEFCNRLSVNGNYFRNLTFITNLIQIVFNVNGFSHPMQYRCYII